MSKRKRVIEKERVQEREAKSQERERLAKKKEIEKDKFWAMREKNREHKRIFMQEQVM